MRKTEPEGPWVVYLISTAGKASVYAVCQQREWEEMEQRQPGQHQLIRKGIASEAEAEAVARESPGGTDKPIRLKGR